MNGRRAVRSRPATVAFEVHASRLAFSDESMRFVTEPGTFRVSVGGASDTAAVHPSVDLAGDVAEYRPREIVATTATRVDQDERR